MGYPNSKDEYGATYDSTGRNYTTTNGEQATHGQLVNVNDGYGNFKPGIMDNGVAKPFDQQN